MPDSYHHNISIILNFFHEIHKNKVKMNDLHERSEFMMCKQVVKVGCKL